MKKLLSILAALHLMTMANAQQQEIPLYDGAIPNSKPTKDLEKAEGANKLSLSLVSRPTLKIYLPSKEKATGMGIVVVPGGAYHHLAMGHEGVEIAEKLNEMGIAAFVLKYRLPSDETMVNKEIGPLQDAQRAIQLVRQNAGKWGVDTGRVGIIGFSAGGHLASTAGTHFSKAYIDNPDNISLRPNFMILMYPVISFSDSIAHRGSRENLIGKAPSPEKIREYSNELQVTPATPPAFLIHAGDDQVVLVANSIHFYEALQQNGVPAEMHIYPHGGHGFGLHNNTTKDLWFDRLITWLGDNGWMKR
ncbi:alpha/beta hydrolase [Flavitalea sp. BT771]|uniref:alpha/beta hydrolase n=1 Tax=Flavitalea sp. BT771 TaxID=3063329 RepID=UPI0026E3F01C|nr:alpha/beta hydrolase [Flavitalea sp. BT771]MDO6429224.1 alpha/beta hydrolase [Flavitalea sp. BT771]MDV6218648.1 alpha/beta hydrolase [Flavitalea sp. BT771]